MRVMQLWNRVPFHATSKLVWDRVTFSRLTIAYFVFSFLHAIVQISLQIKAFTVNAETASFLKSIIIQGDSTNGGLPILSGSSLYMCGQVPLDLSLNGGGCDIAWNGTKGINDIGIQLEAAPRVPSTSSTSLASIVSATSSTYLTSTFSATPTSSVVELAETVSPSSPRQTVTIFVPPTPTSVNNPVDDDGEDQDLSSRTDAEVMDSQTRVQITGMGFDNVPATLDKICLETLNWPVSVLDNTKREDLVFVAFQLWVLGVSIVALLNESIPHILASLVTHLMATAWAGFKVTSTIEFRSDFGRVVTNGACNGISLLPRYWSGRIEAEIASISLNVFALLVSCFLTWKLVKLFGWQTFKRVGASLTINRVYRIVLIFSITIQLCLFFIIVTVSLWLDRLWNDAIEDKTTFEKLYKTTSIITLTLTIPWLATGWYAVRRELRVPMFIFLMLSLLYLGGWSVMFFSVTFRWTFVTWRFFSVMASASVTLTAGSFVLGVICRFNFGKGLLRYLNANQELPDDNDVYKGDPDIEKFEFPRGLVPTYSASFGPGPHALPPCQWYTNRGPRTFDRHAGPFGTPRLPHAAHMLARSVSSASSKRNLIRSDSLSSDKSFGNVASSNRDYTHTQSDSQEKRWEIEW